ncbi:melatonin receptor type 1B-B-like [Lytechinus variegatus]|uniref:melatonin receptor type 1B-B-like n=1 Tax=Lytechinus variegatus TaxID=7654 RepID=UPI001BB0F56D|nr:melatonin receptor type 1B-B-like [Lytechinus variegatus]
MNITHNSSVEVVPFHERLVMACFYIVVATFGTVGNVLVIIAISFSKKLQNPTNAFVLSLGFADLLVSTMQPLQVVGLLAKDGWPLTDQVCEMAGSTIVISITSSVITLAMISINRHCLITKSRKVYVSIYRGRNIFLMVLISWLLPIGILIIPQAAGYGKLGYDKFTHLCAWDFAHPLAKFYQIIAAMIGVFSYSIILVCYSLIYLHLKRHSLSLQRHSSNLSTNRIDSKVKVNIKITKNLFYIVCVYMVCVVPYSICLIAISETNSLARHASLYLALILVMNSCANVIIYGLKHPHFQIVFKCIITCNLSKIPKPSAFLRFLLNQKSESHLAQCNGVPSDKPVNLTSDTWLSPNSSKKKKPLS